MAERRLRVFQAVAQHRSFTRAAESLYMTQPTVTFQIKQLEDRFNTRLLDRGPGGVSLTPAGEVLLEYANRIIELNDELDEKIADLTGQMRGPLRVGTSASLAAKALPPVLRAFADAYPAVPVHLSVIDSAATQQEILERRIDLGVLAVADLAAGLEATPVGEQEFVVVCAPDHPLARGNATDAASLMKHRYVAREQGAVTRKAFEDYLKAQGIDPGTLAVAFEVATADALNAVVAAGCGFSVVARTAAWRELESRRLVALSLQPKLVRPVAIVQLANRYRSRLLSAFVDLAQRRLREPLR